MWRAKQAFGLALVGVIACGSVALGAEAYPSMNAALGDAMKFMQKRDYKSAQGPLEAALKLAADDNDRLRIYNNLMACYRLLPENDKMIEACEFTMAKTKLDAERSLTAGSLTSFMFQRGKLDETRKDYEARLAKDPNDLIALSMMATICRVHFDDRKLAADYKARLDKAEQKRAVQLAEEEESLTDKDTKDPETRHWMQAAVYWTRAGQTEKAIQAAKKAEDTGPEKRSESLLHHWHRRLGDVYLAANLPQDAIRHFTKAIETTQIAGYKTDCEKKLAEAKSKLATQGP